MMKLIILLSFIFAFSSCTGVPDAYRGEGSTKKRYNFRTKDAIERNNQYVQNYWDEEVFNTPEDLDSYYQEKYNSNPYKPRTRYSSYSRYRAPQQEVYYSDSLSPQYYGQYLEQYKNKTQPKTRSSKQSNSSNYQNYYNQYSTSDGYYRGAQVRDTSPRERQQYESPRY